MTYELHLLTVAQKAKTPFGFLHFEELESA
jgi:hypothetical protein